MISFRFSIKSLWLVLFAMSILSCSTTKLKNKEEDQHLRTMSPPPDMALFYFVRPSIAGFLVRMGITCDSTPIGSTTGKRYIYAFVKPGKHEFISKSENKAELSIVAEAGNTYFVEQIPKGGWFITRNEIVVVEDSVGRKKLTKCKLSGNCPAYSMQNNLKP